MTTKGSRLSRRSVIAWTAAGIGGLGAMAASALNRTWFADDGRGARSWWDGAARGLEHAGYNEWHGHVGSMFELATEGGLSSFKLVSVTPLPDRGSRPETLGRDRAFLASFEGPPHGAGNRTYTARHASGSLDIFFGPAESAGSVSRLGAVFN